MSARNQRGLIVLIPIALLVAACSATPTSGPAGSRVAGAVATPTAAPMPPAISPEPVPTASMADEPVPTATAEVPAVENTQPTATVAGYAAFELDHYAAHAGDDVTLRGNGFAPGETVRLHFTGSPPVLAGEIQANDRGELPGSVVRIPPLAEGEHTLIATGLASGREAARGLSVIGFHPWVVLSSYALHPGESFGFTGSEFIPWETVHVFLDGGNTPISTVQVDDRGNVRHEALLRATPELVGKHSLVFAGSEGGAHPAVDFEVLPFVPIMELAPYAGPPGSVVSFTGHGFAPGETIRAYLEEENGRRELSTFQADSNGAFEAAGQVIVPVDSATEQLALTLEGAESRVPVSQRFGVLALSPWAGLSSYSGPAGTAVDLLGKGFAAGETVTAFLGRGESAEQVASAVAGAEGDFSVGPVTIPADAQGSVTFTFRGQNSRGEAAAEFTVTGESR